jgi:hypothetical protein
LLLGSDTPFNFFDPEVIESMGLSLKATKLDRPVRNRQFTSLTGIGPDESVGCFNNSLHNAVQTICCRVLCAERNGKWMRVEDTRPIPGAIPKYLGDLTADLVALLPSTTPVPLELFPLSYKGRKFKIYTRAVESLRIKPLDINDSVIKMFLKLEKDIRSLKPARIARAISSPDPRFLVETGRFVKVAEHLIYEAIDKLYGNRVVAKGLNFGQVGELFEDCWSDFNRPCSIDCDVEKMDRSTTVEMMQWTHQITSSCFSGYDRVFVETLLSWQIDTIAKGRTDDGKFSYLIEGTLNSGQTNTSLVGVLMVSMIMHAYIKSKSYRVRFVDAGDDCTVICDQVNETDFRSGLQPFFIQFGFVLTLGSTNDVLEGIEFCQAHPVKINGKYRMVRNNRTAAVKDAVCPMKIETPRQFVAWTQAVSDTGIATHGGVPVAQDYYAMLSRSAQTTFQSMNLTYRQRSRYRSSIKRYSVEGGLHYWGKGMTCRYEPVISTETRISYYLAFGTPPHIQRMLESSYRTKLVKYNYPIESPYINPMRLWF